MSPRRTDTVSRTIAASPESIYAAMVDPEALVVWLPPEGMQGEMLSFDASPGGGYRMVLRYRDAAITGKSGGNQDIVDVRFVDLVPEKRLVQAADFVSDDPDFAGTMTMRWTITPAVSGSLVTLSAENVPPGIARADHIEGMTASLDNLARYLER
jgi:uncharacterized protein YndB with AHSA1/START domain